MQSHSQLEGDVFAELSWDPAVNDRDIHLSVADGIVTLTGTVPTFADRRLAERAAERVSGVKAVANELTVAVPTTFFRSDTEIARTVVNALAWDVQAPDDKIKCAVSNGWVTLEGEVQWRYERDAAVRALRNLSGVRGITNNITVAAKKVAAEDVSRSIKEALERRADRTADHITVVASGGVVTLTGTVSSFGDRRAAEGAAWSAPGVEDVHDELSVVL